MVALSYSQFDHIKISIDTFMIEKRSVQRKAPKNQS